VIGNLRSPNLKPRVIKDRRPKTENQNRKRISLLELMIAMFIPILLVIGCAAQFISAFSKRAETVLKRRQMRRSIDQ